MEAMEPTELATILKENGWELARTKGSHHIFKHKDRPDHIVVPFANSKKRIHRGLACNILAQMKRGDLRVKTEGIHEA